MSPQPYVRRQVLALGASIAIAAAFNAARLAVCMGIVSMLWLLAMHVKYLRDVAATTSWVPPHREELDRVVAFGPLFTIVPATVLATFYLTGWPQPIVDVPAAHGVASALIPTAAVIWGSSLVDWYLILPRITGQLGCRPCRAAEEEEGFRFRKRGARSPAGGTSIAWPQPSSSDSVSSLRQGRSPTASRTSAS